MRKILIIVEEVFYLEISMEKTGIVMQVNVMIKLQKVMI